MMSKVKKKKLILVSLDAWSCTDLQDTLALPNFKRIAEHGAFCSNVNSVYPSLTFPSHASIVTGCNPSAHGIVNNFLFDPYAPIPKWNFYAKNLKKKAIWDYAAQNDKEVLVLSWPVSAGANVKYLMPEMTPAKPKIWNAANFFRQLKVFKNYGTPRFAIKAFLSQKGLPSAWFLGKQPNLDKHMISCFESLIRDTDFDISLLHIYGMDDAKHTFGAASKEAKTYLKLYDDLIGNLLSYIEEHSEENITLMFTGDHSQKDITHAIYGNHILEHMGLLSFRDKKLVDYRAYLESCDGMAYIRVKDGPDKQAVIQSLSKCFETLPGVKKVIFPEEFCTLGCDQQADLIVEAADGYMFESGYCDECTAANNCTLPSHYKAVHGYLPTGKDYQTMFFCYGEDIRPQQIDKMGIVDIMPTLCHWMDMKTESTDGHPLKQLFDDPSMVGGAQ